jgi:hypothetical protein
MSHLSVMMIQYNSIQLPFIEVLVHSTMTNYRTTTKDTKNNLIKQLTEYIYG